jgi:uncharacterized protein (TIGR02186 family)
VTRSLGHAAAVLLIAWTWAAAATIALPRAAEAQLVAALSNHLVAITTGFSGTDLLLFGVTGGTGDVVVVIRGPETKQVVRRKGRRFGIWMNEAEVTFGNVPGYYLVAATRPLEEFLPERVAERHQIGPKHLQLPAVETDDASDIKAFREALIRNKQRVDLYRSGLGEIAFVGGGLFRTDMYIPANAPVGSYTVGVYLIRDGDVVSAEITPLIVSKVGFEARLFDFAHRYAFAYGILAIVIAAVAGWLANLVFRKG